MLVLFSICIMRFTEYKIVFKIGRNWILQSLVKIDITVDYLLPRTFICISLSRDPDVMLRPPTGSKIIDFLKMTPNNSVIFGAK